MPSDEALLEEALRGFLSSLYWFALPVAGYNADLAEDLCSQAFVSTLPRLRSGDVEDLGSYLRRAVVNEGTSRGRRRQTEWRHQQHERTTRARPEPPAEEAVDERIRLATHLAELTVGERAVIVLRFYQDLSVEEVAGILQVTTGTVKSQTNRGLTRLRRIMEGKDDDG